MDMRGSCESMCVAYVSMGFHCDVCTARRAYSAFIANLSTPSTFLCFPERILFWHTHITTPAVTSTIVTGIMTLSHIHNAEGIVVLGASIGVCVEGVCLLSSSTSASGVSTGVSFMETLSYRYAVSALCVSVLTTFPTATGGVLVDELGIFGGEGDNASGTRMVQIAGLFNTVTPNSSLVLSIEESTRRRENCTSIDSWWSFATTEISSTSLCSPGSISVSNIPLTCTRFDAMPIIVATLRIIACCVVWLSREAKTSCSTIASITTL